MGTQVQRSIRLSPFNATTLDRSSGESGGIAYDQTNQTLRISDGKTNGGTLLATRSWVLSNSSNFDGNYNSLTNKPVLFSGSYNDLTNKPTIPSLTGYATETYVNSAINGIPSPDLTNYATKTYVNDAIPSLTGYATETYVNNALGSISLTNVAGLGFARGVVVSEFSTDAMLSDNANDAVPTEAAVKGYVDTNFAPLADPTFTGTVTVGGGGDLYVNRVLASTYGTFDLGASGTGRFATIYGTGVDVAGPLTVTGLATLQQSSEKLNSKSGATGTVTHDFSTGAIWNHTNLLGNFTANFTNVPITNDRTIVCTLILVQGATAYIPSAVQIAGSAQTIKWLGGSQPSGNASKVDIVSFTFTRINATWTVLGSLSTYG